MSADGVKTQAGRALSAIERASGYLLSAADAVEEADEELGAGQNAPLRLALRLERRVDEQVLNVLEELEGLRALLARVAEQGS